MMSDNHNQYINQQMKEFRRGRVIYVCSHHMSEKVEQQINREKIKYKRTTVFNSSNGNVMYAYKKER